MGGANRRVARAGISILAVVVAFVLVWEGYKLIWTAMGWENPVRPDDRTMPHTWDIFLALFRPAQRNGTPFILVELRAALVTLREAFVGFVVGGLIGFGLGVLFVRSTMAERAFMPSWVALTSSDLDGVDEVLCEQSR